MTHAIRQHPNAPLTPKGRRRMVDCVIDKHWTIEQAAERFQVDAKTVRKWRDRFLAEGEPGLQDRSSRPKTSPNATDADTCTRVIELRRERRWGPDHIGHEVGLSSSTVRRIFRDAGIGRLDTGDRASKHKPQRYQRERPGELIHVDVKKIAGIPDGGGHRARGRGYAGEGIRSRKVGYRFIHTALDDRTRLVYSEILDDEKGVTAAGFWKRAAAWFASAGVVCERVITDNGACYRSRDWFQACSATTTAVRKTRPYRPQTNGKVERYHRTLLEEWAYITEWDSEPERHAGYTHFVHFYNHHRSHGALTWATPTATLIKLQDNLPTEHN